MKRSNSLRDVAVNGNANDKLLRFWRWMKIILNDSIRVNNRYQEGQMIVTGRAEITKNLIIGENNR